MSSINFIILTENQYLLNMADIWSTVSTARGTTHVCNVDQRSDLWHNLRKNRITASNAATATGRSTKFKTVAKLASEIRGESSPSPMNAAMQAGIDGEPSVRLWYETYKQITVEEIGFAYPDWNTRIGVSVDGLVGEDGMIEIKCPVKMYYPLVGHTKRGAPITPVDVRPKHIWESHYIQMQMGMSILEREWCDYVVADISPEKEANIYLERVYFNEKYWLEIESELNVFIKEYLDTLPEPILY